MNSTRIRFGTLSLAGWLASAAVVAAVHVGGAALVFVQWPEPDTSFDASGVVPVELAPLPTSTAIDNPEAAPGPTTQEAPNTPEASRQVDVKLPDSIPVPEAPLAPQPEVVLPDAKPREEVVEEKPEEKPSPNNPTDPSVGDPMTRAPPKIEAPVAATTAAPGVGVGREAILAQATWQKSLMTHLNVHKRYPGEARARGQQGTVKVQFVIDRKGKVLDAVVLDSAGSSSLDAEALAVLLRASPLPPPPDVMSGETILLTLPIQFHIR